MKVRSVALAALAGLALCLRMASADTPDGHGNGVATGDQSPAYVAVRAKMVASGFKPLVLKHDANDYFCAGDDLCRTYPEVLSCVMAGAPACRMALFNQASGRYMLVITNSDHLPMMVTTMMDASSYDIADIRARQ